MVYTIKNGDWLVCIVPIDISYSNVVLECCTRTYCGRMGSMICCCEVDIAPQAIMTNILVSIYVVFFSLSKVQN